MVYYLALVLAANFEFDVFRKQKQKYAAYAAVSTEAVRMAKSRPRMNKSQRSDLPQGRLAI